MSPSSFVTSWRDLARARPALERYRALKVAGTAGSSDLLRPTTMLEDKTEVTHTLEEIPELGVIAADIVQFERDVLRLRFRHFGWSARGTLEGWRRSKARV